MIQIHPIEDKQQATPATMSGKKRKSSHETKPFVIPKGYVSGDEFVRKVIDRLEKRLKADGYLQ